MPDTLTYTGKLVIHACWCGIRHSIPAELDSEARNGRTVYCPLGHQWVYRETDLDRERKRAARLERQLTAERDTSARWRANAEANARSAAAYKGHLTRAKNRIANGVCPVPGCRRSGFTRVMAHIASQHPDWLHQHPDLDQ